MLNKVDKDGNESEGKVSFDISEINFVISILLDSLELGVFAI